MGDGKEAVKEDGWSVGQMDGDESFFHSVHSTIEKPILDYFTKRRARLGNEFVVMSPSPSS